MPLTTYQLVNPAAFKEQDQLIGGYGEDRIILKGYNKNPMWQYKGYLHWNEIMSTGNFFFSCCRITKINTAGIEHTEKDRAIHKASQSNDRDNWHPLNATKPDQAWPKGGGVEQYSRCYWTDRRLRTTLSRVCKSNLPWNFSFIFRKTRPWGIWCNWELGGY